MRRDLEFLLGLLDDAYPAAVAWEDFEGEHGAMLRTLQRQGFLSREGSLHPVPSCPHCYEGVPYQIADRYLCDQCHSTVDARHLLLWSFNLGALLRWLSAKLRLRGGVRQMEPTLWQLGTLREGSSLCECFFRRPGPLSDGAKNRLVAYRNVLLCYGRTPPRDAHPGTPCVSLLEVLDLGRSLTVRGDVPLLRTRGRMRFDAGSGALFVGDVWMGEVPVGSKEFFFLAALASRLDHFVPYSDLKRSVLECAGSIDSTEEATFCQGLKSRIKRKWIAGIDQCIATTNKGDGYRLKAYADVR